MAKRASLVGSMMAAKAEAATPTPPGTTGAPAGQNRASEPMVTTAVHVPHRVLSLLRRVAVERANLHGGRPSVSAVLSDLVEQHRAELEKEAEGGR
jgi:hypothetical protein